MPTPPGHPISDNRKPADLLEKRSLPPLIALRAFEAFARRGLVRVAADELAVSHTVISRHIQNLELSIGMKLVKKEGRGLLLTPEGAQFAQQLGRAFDIIAMATTDLRRGEENSLHICCMAGLAARRLLRMLPEIEEFIGVHGITLEPTTASPDLLRGEADVEITYSEAPPSTPGVLAEVFAQPRILAVASPGFARAHPGLTRAADLVNLPLIHERSTHQWESWLAKAGVEDIPKLRGPRLWHGHLSLEGAKLGQGVALVSSLIGDSAIEAGDLVEVVPSHVRLGNYYIIAAARRWQEQPIQRLRDWLVLTFAAETAETATGGAPEDGIPAQMRMPATPMPATGGAMPHPG